METLTKPEKMIEFNKKGRIVEATVKVKDATIKADCDMVLLTISCVMISVINLLYITGIFGAI